MTGNRGVDVVLEHVGTATWDDSIKSMASGGETGDVWGDDRVRREDRFEVLFSRQLSLLGSYMGTKEELRTVLKLVAQGRLRPTVDRVFALKDCAAAHEYLEQGKQFGKVVLRVE